MVPIVLVATALQLAVSKRNDRPRNDRSCDDFDSYTNSIFSNNLCGELYLPTDGDAYLKAADQYAQSSYPDRVKPSMIIEAICDEDIKLAISYATKCEYTIAIRSGGHQYSGLSSCNSSCIQIDMKQYDQVIINAVDDISMGPGVGLGDVFGALDENDMTLPGGTCAYVALGGHVQTGGLGHTIRSDGALADHVTAFDIILSDGSMHHVTKPDVNAADEWNDDLFWATLGGNPGSWGVITNYEFEANENAATSTNTLYECFFMYDSDTLRDILRNLVDIHNDEGYLNNRDVGIWITMGKREPSDMDFMRIGCVWHGVDNKPYDSTYCDQLMTITTGAMGNCNTMPMSTSKAFKDVWAYDVEREFDHPYVRSERITSVNWDYDFVDSHVARMDELFSDTTNGIFVAEEIVSIGGQGSMADANDPDNTITALSHKGALLLLVTDLFYAESINPNAKKQAVQWREDAWSEWMDSGLFNEGRDSRLMWSTFQNLDIETVWPYYYEADTYARLKKVKKVVDPINLFRNEFTIPVVEEDDDKPKGKRNKYTSGVMDTLGYDDEDIEVKVVKALREAAMENLNGWSESEISAKLIDGLSSMWDMVSDVWGAGDDGEEEEDVYVRKKRYN